ADMATSTTAQGARTSYDNLASAIARHPKTRGIVQARTALSYATTRCASPLETRTRLVAVLDAGIDDWLVNVPVFDLHENLLGIADLLNVRSALVLESDGGDHRKVPRHNADNAREEGFERHNCTVVRVGAADHSARPDLVRRIFGG